MMTTIGKQGNGREKGWVTLTVTSEQSNSLTTKIVISFAEDPDTESSTV